MKKAPKVLSILMLIVGAFNFCCSATELSVITKESHDLVTVKNICEENNTPNSFVPQFENNNYKSDICGGTILQAWCWSFNTIAKNIPEIAKAGFTAVQTSPISTCLVGDKGGMSILSEKNGKWYYHYQPTNNFKIGNYQLGTEKEFEQMCKVAKQYNVKIIVDAVLNHCTTKYDLIADEIKNIPGGALHKNDEIFDFDNRHDLTQKALLSLWDLNTQNENVQKAALKFLRKCTELGASGFRFDAARHIELPVPWDDPSYASNFWPTVLKNGAEFNYGEILQGSADNIEGYSALMNVTASHYGLVLRSAVKNQDILAKNISDYCVNNIPAWKLITWPESHDNYCNDETWKELDDNDIVCLWAMITARKHTTPLFFNRPKNSSKEKPYGDNIIGEKGNDLYKSRAIVALNHFRKDMKNEDDRLYNQGKPILFIERGNKGLVAVNVGKKATIFTKTNLKNGVYIDKVSGKQFKVIDHILIGKMDERSVAVLYDGIPANAYIKNRNNTVIYFDNSELNWDKVYIYLYQKNSNKPFLIKPWPGVPMVKIDKNLYSFSIFNSFDNLCILFSDGHGRQIPDRNQPGFLVRGGDNVIFSDGNMIHLKNK